MGTKDGSEALKISSTQHALDSALNHQTAFMKHIRRDSTSNATSQAKNPRVQKYQGQEQGKNSFLPALKTEYGALEDLRVERLANQEKVIHKHMKGLHYQVVSLRRERNLVLAEKERLENRVDKLEGQLKVVKEDLEQSKMSHGDVVASEEGWRAEKRDLLMRIERLETSTERSSRKPTASNAESTTDDVGPSVSLQSPLLIPSSTTNNAEVAMCGSNPFHRYKPQSEQTPDENRTFWQLFEECSTVPAECRSISGDAYDDCDDESTCSTPEEDEINSYQEQIISWGVSELRAMLFGLLVGRIQPTSAPSSGFTQSAPGPSQRDKSRDSGHLVDVPGQSHVKANAQIFRQSHESSPESDEEEDEGRNNKRQRRDKNIEKSRRAKKFACHFFKRYPNVYGDKSACTGPGYPNREEYMKHLRKSHKAALRCPRCQVPQVSQLELNKHLRMSPSCETSQHVTIEEGISVEKMERLAERVLFRGKSEEDKWRIVWEILFPDADFVPSPYYEYFDFIAYSRLLSERLNIEFQQNSALRSIIERISRDCYVEVTEAVLLTPSTGSEYIAEPPEYTTCATQQVSDLGPNQQRSSSPATSNVTHRRDAPREREYGLPLTANGRTPAPPALSSATSLFRSSDKDRSEEHQSTEQHFIQHAHNDPSMESVSLQDFEESSTQSSRIDPHPENVGFDDFEQSFFQSAHTHPFMELCKCEECWLQRICQPA